MYYFTIFHNEIEMLIQVQSFRQNIFVSNTCKKYLHLYNVNVSVWQDVSKEIRLPRNPESESYARQLCIC